MTLTVEAIYENGVLKPLQPLPLKEQERVVVLVGRLPGAGSAICLAPPRRRRTGVLSFCARLCGPAGRSEGGLLN